MKRTILIFSLLIFCLLLLFQINKFTFFKGDLDQEVLIAVIAITFFFIGVFLNRKNSTDLHLNQSPGIDYHLVKALKISDREYDVLLALSEDLSNREIAEKLYISESTTKTHVSRLLAKLDVSKRSKAVKKAKALHVI